MSASVSTPRRSPARWFFYVGIVILVALGVWYFSRPTKQAGRRGPGGGGPNPAWAGKDPQPAMPVRVEPVQRRDLTLHLKAIGTVTPVNTVIVRSRVDGQLLRFTVEEGQRVEQGQVIAEIDSEPYRIQLAQAEGQQRQNIALLETARADLSRFQQLFDKNLVTNQEMEGQQSLVREREGAVAADKARMDEARLQLAYTRIEAPISGRLGLRRVDAGNLIRANDTNGLVVISETRPVAVMFTIPEVDLQKVVAPLRAGGQLAVDAWDRTDKTRLAQGVLTTIDNQIDLATGTLRLKATFPNEDEKLFPNQFVNVRLEVSTLKGAIIIPAAAVQYGSRGTYVYVINAQNQATLRDLTLGPTDGVAQAVADGLQPGEQVVIEGLDRLREGRSVVVVKDGAIVSAKP